MLRIVDLEFRRGEEPLFEQLNLVVHAGQRVAVAGRNGAGKSTLFQLILGQLSADAGELDLPKDWRIAHMAQEVSVTDRTAIDYVLDGHRELREVESQIADTQEPEQLAQLHMRYDDLDGYLAPSRAGEILHGLGFAADAFHQSYRSFSGGWRIRLNLARALMTPCDLLLLDEPTNHLDLEAIVWLEQWLCRFDGTVLLIAHDRSFLDQCVDHTLYLSRQRGRFYRGNYSAFERQRSEQLQQEQSLAERQATKAAHIQQFVDRFRAKASKAKQVQSRLKALEKLQFTATLQAESPYRINFNNPKQTSNPLFSFRNLTLGYDDLTVLSNISQTISPGARIGVLGANGAGKSTLLKCLVGELTPIDGELTWGRHSQVAYFAQHQLDTLDGRQTPLATMAVEQPSWREQQVRDYLGGWGFNKSMLERPIETLSGGEKARLVLAIIAAQEPAILVLDEPTNHLDMDMRDALAMALQDFTGAVVIVSHDRSLLSKTVDELWVLNAQNLSVLSGDLDDYVSLSVQQSVNNEATAAPESSRKSQRQQRAQQRQALKQLRDKVRALEQDIESCSTELRQMEAQLADSDTYQNMEPDALDELLARAGRRRSRLEQLEEDWLHASDALERAGQQHQGDAA